MSAFTTVTDADLARARQDPHFRYKLVADNLEHLLAALNKARAAAVNDDPECTRQIKEGVDLAVKLADVLHKIADEHPHPPRLPDRSLVRTGENC